MDIELIVYNIILFIPTEICTSSVETNSLCLKEQEKFIVFLILVFVLFWDCCFLATNLGYYYGSARHFSRIDWRSLPCISA